MSKDNPHNELGRRILAALISYQGGISMDYAMKKYVPSEVDPSWGDVGWHLLGVITASRAKKASLERPD